MTMKLHEVFTYSKLQLIKGKPTQGKIAGSELLGIEIEGEDVICDLAGINSFKGVGDGSLRNGLEFVSVPIKLDYLEYELTKLAMAVDTIKFTERCSVHVHLNVRDLEEEELHKLLILYSIYEKSLFSVSGNRQNNIYTIPILGDSHLLKEFILRPYSGWNKYSALNLLPIWGHTGQGTARLGTIEFRHHEGTLETRQLLNWCNLIVSLKVFAKRTTLAYLEALLLDTNTTSSYITLTEDVFTDWAPLITNKPTFKADIESSITRTKYILFNSINDKLHLFRYSEDKKRNNDGVVVDNVLAENGRIAQAAQNLREMTEARAWLDTPIPQEIVDDVLPPDWFEEVLTIDL